LGKDTTLFDNSRDVPTGGIGGVTYPPNLGKFCLFCSSILKILKVSLKISTGFSENFENFSENF
jgi:hypothetical protein